MPLGVWVVRKEKKKSLKSKGIEFASKELMLNYAKHLVKRKFGYDLCELLPKSLILTNKQTRLTAY